MFQANEGKPALELIDNTVDENSKPEYANKGVVIVRDEVEE